MKTLMHSLIYIYKKKHNENCTGLWYGSLCQSVRDLNLPPNSAFPFFNWKMITMPALVLFIISMHISTQSIRYKISNKCRRDLLFIA